MIGAEFKGMSSVDLQHACQARGLNSDGTKAQLVRKLTVKFRGVIGEGCGCVYGFFSAGSSSFVLFIYDVTGGLRAVRIN